MGHEKLTVIQMAKRMKFSVVGLPHYTVWHLYEPSVDDIRHMEEMAQEQKNRENEEKERVERLKKIKEEFKESTNQWEKDKSELEGIARSDGEVTHNSNIVHVGDERGPIAQPAKDSSDADSRVVGGHVGNDIAESINPPSREKAAVGVAR